MRHVQLKATAAMGTRASVDIQVALGDKPGGCVVWIFVDPKTLHLGPFLWLGGEAGCPLPPLGDRAVRHSKGDATGLKKVRAGLRRVPKGMFARVETMQELAMAMFERPPRDHATILVEHLESRRTSIERVVAPLDLRWANSRDLAYTIDGYTLAEQADLGDAIQFYERKRAEAERDGRWEGSTVELWVTLFMEHRRDYFSGTVGHIVDGVSIDIASAEPPMLDELCAALTASIQRDRGY